MTVNRNSVNGEGVFSGANVCKDNDGGVNASGTFPGRTDSTFSVAASSSSWAPPASPSTSTPLMRAAAMAWVSGLASSSVAGSVASPASSEYDVLYASSHAAGDSWWSSPSPVPAAAKQCSGRKVRRSVRDETLEAHGRAIPRERTMAGYSFGN